MCYACPESPGLKSVVSKYVKLLCVHFASRFLYRDGKRRNKAHLCSEVKYRVCWDSEFWRVRRKVLEKWQPSWSKALPRQRKPGGKSAYENGRSFHGAGELTTKWWTKKLVKRSLVADCLPWFQSLAPKHNTKRKWECDRFWRAFYKEWYIDVLYKARYILVNQGNINN